MTTSTSSAADERCTEAELARSLGVSRQAINDLVKRGIIVKDDDDRIDVEQAKKSLVENLRVDAKTLETQPNVDGDTTSKKQQEINYHAARTIRELAEAHMAKIKLRQLTGELVEVARVEIALANAAARVGFILDRIADKLSLRLAAVSDSSECHRLISAETDSAKRELADGMRALNRETDGV